MACQSLSKVTLRSCDLVGGEANRASVDLALADIFPLLLEKGMASPAKEVRGIRWAVEGRGGEGRWKCVEGVAECKGVVCVMWRADRRRTEGIGKERRREGGISGKGTEEGRRAGREKGMKRFWAGKE